MKLICIESGELPNARGGISKNHYKRVCEGQTYTANKRRIDEDGDDVYYIIEVGMEKQAIRFLEISEVDEMVSLNCAQRFGALRSSP